MNGEKGIRVFRNIDEALDWVLPRIQSFRTQAACHCRRLQYLPQRASVAGSNASPLLGGLASRSPRCSDLRPPGSSGFASAGLARRVTRRRLGARRNKLYDPPHASREAIWHRRTQMFSTRVRSALAVSFFFHFQRLWRGANAIPHGAMPIPRPSSSPWPPFRMHEPATTHTPLRCGTSKTATSLARREFRATDRRIGRTLQFHFSELS